MRLRMAVFFLFFVVHICWQLIPLVLLYPKMSLFHPHSRRVFLPSIEFGAGVFFSPVKVFPSSRGLRVAGESAAFNGVARSQVACCFSSAAPLAASDSQKFSLFKVILPWVCCELEFVHLCFSPTSGVFPPLFIQIMFSVSSSRPSACQL